MKPEFIEDGLARQSWVAPAESALEKVSEATLDRSGSAVRKFLHGSWMGHALHPAVVTVPIGAFTATAVMDALDATLGAKQLRPGSDAALGVGLVSSTMAAATGLADWSRSSGAGRRVGVLHASFNGSATLFYLASFFLRRNDQRRAGIITGFIGWLLLMVGGYLGGRLVGNHRLGVDHADRHGTDGFKAIFPETELPENEPHRAEVDGVGVLVVKQHGKIFAVGEKCAHLGGPLAEGKLGEGTITCPWHGSKFDLESGKVLDGPSAYMQPCWEARVRNGQVEVRLAKKNI